MNHPRVQWLVATLFQGNMRAWVDMQKWLMAHRLTFKFYHMDTQASGQRGFLIVCRACTRVRRRMGEKHRLEFAQTGAEA